MMLCVGLALSMTATASAGERSRGGAEGREAVRSSSVDTSATRTVDTTPTFELIAPGVAKVRTGSFETTMRANGMIDFNEELAQFGTVEEYMLAVRYAAGVVGNGNDGEQVLPDNAILKSAAFVGQAHVLIETAEDRMSHVANAETTVNGTDIVLFADGMIGRTQDQPYVSSIPTVLNAAGVEIRADGHFRN